LTAHVSDGAVEGAVSDADLLAAYPGDDISPVNAPLYRGFLRRSFRIPRCQKCGAWQYPIQPTCRRCWSASLEWREVGPTGVVQLWSAVALPVHFLPSDVPLPVTMVSVAFDGVEGVRITSALLDAPAQTVTGARVRLDWLRYGAGLVPVFVLDAE
jgi:uncharacterized protein